MSKDSIIESKSRQFAEKAVRMYKYLVDKEKEYIMSKQVLRSGTSIGANVHEAKYAESRKDFISKMSVALKEASETEYWIELLRATGYLKEKQYEDMIESCREIIRILISIVKSTKTN